MISFHTPQLPEPLDLDLAHLSGGGACPSQFTGETHDGTEIYVRYRGGRLTVGITDQQGTRNEILRCEIGPHLDGSISLTQFCEYFGVTVRGVIPTETAPDAHRNSDLSGQTTFWKAYQQQVTVETARDILGACGEALPNALLVEPLTTDRFQLERLVHTTPQGIVNDLCWVIDGAQDLKGINISPKDYVLPKEGQLHIMVQHTLWKHPEPRYSDRVVQLIEKEMDQTLAIAGSRGQSAEAAIAVDTMSLAAKIPTLDQTQRGQLVRLSDAIEAIMPQTSLDWVALKTGNVVRPLDPALLAWCANGTGRWLAVTRDGRDAPWLGLRPSQTRTN